MIANNPVNLNMVINVEYPKCINVVSGPCPKFYLVYLKVDSNLHSSKHTPRCHYFTLYPTWQFTPFQNGVQSLPQAGALEL